MHGTRGDGYGRWPRPRPRLRPVATAGSAAVKLLARSHELVPRTAPGSSFFFGSHLRFDGIDLGSGSAGNRCGGRPTRHSRLLEQPRRIARLFIFIQKEASLMIAGSAVQRERSTRPTALCCSPSANVLSYYNTYVTIISNVTITGCSRFSQAAR